MSASINIIRNKTLPNEINKLDIKYNTNTYIINKSKNIYLSYYNYDSYIKFNNDRYYLRKIKFYTPSLHNFDNQSRKIEIQLIHENITNTTKNKLIICERNDMENQNIGKIWHIFRRIFYRFADKITTNSKKNYNMLKRYTKKNRIYFIPNHILQKKLPAKKQEKIILSVGRLHPQKGFPELIKAYALTKASYNKLTLH